jgi:hypothetical protein
MQHSWVSAAQLWWALQPRLLRGHRPRRSPVLLLLLLLPRHRGVSALGAEGCQL